MKIRRFTLWVRELSASLRLGVLDRFTIAAVIIALVMGVGLLFWLLGNVNRIEIVNEWKLPDTTSLSPFTGLPCADPDRRPLAVMLASDPEARPLSGLVEAEIVFEIPVTPNALTRLMAVYLCTFPDEIGSIRSARTAFLGYAGSLDAVYAHWGGERDALASLNDGLLDNINALVYEGSVFYRKNGVPAPHDGFTTSTLLLEKAKDLDYADTASSSFLPHRSARSSRSLGNSVQEFTVRYQSGSYVDWTYDASSNLWSRDRDGEPEVDAETGEVVRAGTVIILETEGTPVRGEYLSVRTTGEGKGSLFQDGTRRTITWHRPTDTSLLSLTDTSGISVGIAPGPVWIMLAIEGMVIE